MLERSFRYVILLVKSPRPANDSRHYATIYAGQSLQVIEEVRNTPNAIVKQLPV